VNVVAGGDLVASGVGAITPAPAPVDITPDDLESKVATVLRHAERIVRESIRHGRITCTLDLDVWAHCICSGRYLEAHGGQHEPPCPNHH
jgi:hypothetical protein